jgi:CBS domain-containing protein
MSSPVVTVTRSTSIDDCMHQMTTARCRHLPVIENGQVVGLVSIGDLVKWIISAQGFALDQLEGYVSGKYPA